jgi:hypothetical protein
MIVDAASTSLDIHLGPDAAGRWSRFCEVASNEFLHSLRASG